MDYEKKYKEALERASRLRVQNPFDTVSQMMEHVFPELAESKDERIRKGLLKMFNHYVRNNIELNEYDLDKDMVLAWLEKQGKQKHIKNIVETWKDMRFEVYQRASGNRHEPNYSDDTTKMFSLNDIDEIIEKMSEQKPTDDVETKFHVNEWVVTAMNDVVQIKAVNNGHYTIDNGMEFNMPYVEGYWHKWTMQDAKSGDVLVASDGSIFLFGGVDDSACKYYAALTADNYIKINKEAKGGYWETSRAVYPATKKQRDLLFKKMHEEGYEWDTEKKELTKIEQEPTWSEEDEMFVHGLIRGLAAKRDMLGHTTFGSDCIDITEAIFWLKSLKDRVQPKQEWSEDDEITRNALINLVEMYYGSYINKSEKNRLLSWLKSLKPQNTWKPNEEQMDALETAVSSIQSNTLETLYQDLKKLKG